MERIRWEGQNFSEVVAPQEEECISEAIYFFTAWHSIKYRDNFIFGLANV
jgi:hypothetical protein